MVFLGSQEGSVRWGREASRDLEVMMDRWVRAERLVRWVLLDLLVLLVSLGNEVRWVRRGFAVSLMDRLPTSCWLHWPTSTCRILVAEGAKDGSWCGTMISMRGHVGCF